MNIKYIFWDNDGTLVNTEPQYYAATKEVLAEIGIDLNKEYYEEHTLRKGMSSFDMALTQGVSRERIEEMRLVRDEIYLKKLESYVELMEGRVELLEKLYGEIPMAIVTSAKRMHFEQIMKSAKLDRFMNFIITADDVENIKPNPEPYLKAWKKVGLKKEECLVIEDTERGVDAAKEAGLICFALPNHLSKNNDFSKADRVLGSIEELFEILSLPNL